MSINKYLTMVSRIAIIKGNSYINLDVDIGYDTLPLLITAATSLGIEAQIFERSDGIIKFNPDIVITLNYLEPKLTYHPTYLIFPKNINNIPDPLLFARNILSYDGIILQNLESYGLSETLFKQASKKLYATYAPITQPCTQFKTLNYKNAQLAYTDINWDALSYGDYFSYLAPTNKLKVYGSIEKWNHYPANMYGGPLPDANQEILNIYRKYGMGLLADFADQPHRGTAMSRLNEIIAANAIAICIYDNNFEPYGDSILYLNPNDNAIKLAEMTEYYINYIRENPGIAQEMARSAHEIFNKQFSMETTIEKIITLHDEVTDELGYSKVGSGLSSCKVNEEKITYIIIVNNLEAIDATFNSIKAQAYNNFNILLLVNNIEEANDKLIMYRQGNVFIQPYKGLNNNIEIINFLISTGTEWIGILNNDDRIFPQHSSIMMNAYHKSSHNKMTESLVGIYANNLEHSHTGYLNDKISSEHYNNVQRNVRIGNIHAQHEIPLCACLFKLKPNMFAEICKFDFRNINYINFMPSLTPLQWLIHAKTITCSENVATEKDGINNFKLRILSTIADKAFA